MPRSQRRVSPRLRPVFRPRRARAPRMLRQGAASRVSTRGTERNTPPQARSGRKPATALTATAQAPMAPAAMSDGARRAASANARPGEIRSPSTPVRTRRTAAPPAT